MIILSLSLCYKVKLLLSRLMSTNSSRHVLQGPVALSMIGAKHWMRGIKTYTFLCKPCLEQLGPGIYIHLFISRQQASIP